MHIKERCITTYADYCFMCPIIRLHKSTNLQLHSKSMVNVHYNLLIKASLLNHQNVSSVSCQSIIDTQD